MAYSLTWLPQALVSAGLSVIEQPGWETRGHSDMAELRGVLLHDTAGRLPPNDLSSLPTVVNGRGGPDPISGPLANLYVSSSGVWYVVAAGKAYHAGKGEIDGVVGIFNASLIGIEIENHGVPGTDPWSEALLDSCAKGSAALLKHMGLPIAALMGHREYCLPKGRKIDPDIDLDQFRDRVQAYMNED